MSSEERAERSFSMLWAGSLLAGGRLSDESKQAGAEVIASEIRAAIRETWQEAAEWHEAEAKRLDALADNPSTRLAVKTVAHRESAAFFRSKVEK